ncbi:hypothetical protein BRADI_1g69044v3 [Brachypodium distachyon]|uniref:Uncharacterized protein n=1 Tax=Brachypodium distachyon TaxID=15368 RepID=A0A2K2DU36_BRADI|nr:hypothetical protein BRADI_1g69044v3 [Brachypodium distachyon]
MQFESHQLASLYRKRGPCRGKNWIGVPGTGGMPATANRGMKTTSRAPLQLVVTVDLVLCMESIIWSGYNRKLYGRE